MTDAPRSDAPHLPPAPLETDRLKGLSASSPSSDRSEPAASEPATPFSVGPLRAFAEPEAPRPSEPHLQVVSTANAPQSTPPNPAAAVLSSSAKQPTAPGRAEPSRIPSLSAPPASYTSPTLEHVRRGNTCAGCGICAGLAPGRVEMRPIAPGYLRPWETSPPDAAQEAQIAATCPGLGQRVAAKGRRDHTLWGPYLEMRRGWAKDADLRHHGSSGAGLSALLIHLLDTGQIEAVVQTAADPADPVGNVTVISSTPAEIRLAAGSRYAPSAPLADLAALLEDGRRFAFVGKPCDVGALRALCDHDPQVARAFPVLLSFFCAGVPSRTGAHAVLKALGAAPEEVSAFRYRGNGWPGEATATLTNGETRGMSYHDSWGKILSKHVQHRCKICADGSGVAADLVCADAWEADARGYPLFENAEGVSLIVTRTATGASLLSQAEAAGVLESQPFEVAKLSAIQPGQRARRQALLARLWALRLTGRPVPRYQGLLLGRAARQSSLTELGRNFFGMLRRALRGRV